MRSGIRVSWLALVAAGCLVAGCGDGDGGEASGEDLAAFCAAVEAVDGTDGTTEDAVVLDALAQFRRTAPPEVRGDVDLVTDNLILNDYPDGVEPSMEEASVEELTEAGSRLATYVEEHCGREA